MRRAVAVLALAVAVLAGGAGPAHAYHERDRCRYEDCDDGGRYGDGGGSSGGDYEGGHSGDQHGGDGSCRNFCNITVPTPPLPGQRAGFIPPNPSKIPQQIADFIKVVSDFVQSVVKFAV